MTFLITSNYTSLISLCVSGCCSQLNFELYLNLNSMYVVLYHEVLTVKYLRNLLPCEVMSG